MNEPIAAHLRGLLGEAAVERTADGLPRALPESTEAVATVCAAAHAAGWRIRIEGGGSWLPPDAPADLAISTVALDRIVRIAPADLVATVQAGATVVRTGSALATEGMWLPVDPPGRPERTLGSVVATGTGGPLRHRHGPVRDHVLGGTIVSADGRIVTAGGQVTKNVAGYDLLKLHAGGFGAFGILTELHLRLRALPASDLTLLARGERDPLTLLARHLEAAHLDAATCELLSPAAAAEATWVLAVRLLGQPASVAEEAERAQALGTGTPWHALEAERSAAFWHTAARAMGGGAVSLRMGMLAEGLDETLDLFRQRLDLGLVSADAGRGGMRWCGSADAGTLREIRLLLAQREIPLTVERAPWSLRRAIGHFGAYREGVGSLVGQLRQRFDPTDLLQVALEGHDGG